MEPFASTQEQPGLATAEAATAPATPDPPHTRPLRLRVRPFGAGVRWAALGIEVLAIVFAILLAFLIDTWWSERQDRRREHAYIVKLIEEFEVNRAELERDLGIRAGLIANYERLLAAMTNHGPALSPDSAGALVYAVPRFRWYTPATAVYDDLIASGGLNLLRSDSLRIAIFRYAQERDRVATVEQGEQLLSRLQLTPYFAEHGELLPWQGDEVYARLRIERPAPGRDPTLFLSDPVFANLVFMRWQRAYFVQSYSEAVLQSVREVLRLLRAEVTR